MFTNLDENLATHQKEQTCAYLSIVAKADHDYKM
jgi:hypothetical protein